ncbi:hypothetical protein L484_026488 [Morus notabilis]|uniref:Uncharacterized protein n=1 Tax=Morus notabilis TaxID=981085 RepID=W9QWD6_9ROSA|nr:hypothetical protein L484_026488 [Morus notabilis]
MHAYLHISEQFQPQQMPSVSCLRSLSTWQPLSDQVHTTWQESIGSLALQIGISAKIHRPHIKCGSQLTFRIIDVRSAILGTKFNFPSELQSLISTLCTDIDEERIINNTTTLERQLEHNSKEKQVNFDLDSTELPSFSETDDDDEKGAKERSTVEDGEQSQQILVPETDVKREEFREPWFSDVLTFWKRMEKGELEEALGR